MSTAKEVLEDMKKRRLLEEALEILRVRTKRNVPLAVCYFVFACLWLWLASLHGLSRTIDGKSFLLLEGTGNVACAAIFFVVSFQQVWVRPNDKLLLLLTEDTLAKRAPNQPSATPPSVTARAGACSAPATDPADL